jgi:poly(3-hydroxybutyrate) depolymerase
MYQRIVFCFFVLIGITVNAQTAINLRGTVSNQAGKPVSSAIVTLVKQGLKDTTGSDGAYSIINNTAVTLPLLLPQNQTITLYRGFLDFSLPNPSPVKVEIFDVKGNLLKKEALQNAVTGFYRINIGETSRTAKLLIIKASIGQDGVTFRYLPLQNGNYRVSQPEKSGAPAEEKRLIKVTAINDTLKTTATGYTAKSMAIASYDQQLNITLDTAGGGAKPSAGCGKTTTLKGEQRLTISVGGKNREYIIRLPDDYEPNTPYRLWFSIHCLGGTAKGVANQSGYEYYGIWKYANPTGGKGTTIFCSPEGTAYSGSSLGWGNSGGADVQFIRALIQKFESELCIDQSRIFAEGFSMGGSMSYALACAMPDTFRAVCMHSGGMMSGCDGSHRGPVPMFITHGTDDGVCSWTGGSGQKQINDLANRDGCTTIDLKTTCKPQDNMHPVCEDYKNCNPGYPCKACIFVGGHEYTPGGASNTWVDDSTWSYFKQF